VITAALLDTCHRQYGIVTTTQLRQELGYDRSRVHRARSDGLLVPMTARTFRIASTPDSFSARCAAVQLHCEAGFLGADTAARLYGLRRMAAQPVHYTVPVNLRTQVPPWVVLHRTRWYRASRDRQQLEDGLVVAVPERMLFGLAARANQYRFNRAAEDAWHLGLTDPPTMAAYLEEHRCRGKDGVKRVERWLEKALQQRAPAHSNLERKIVEALERTGLPETTRQHPLELADGVTIHLDVAWPHLRLAVEPGASWWHGGDAQMRRDQLRDLSCGEVGWMILRIDEELARDPDAIARRIRRVYRVRERDIRPASSDT
jgi:very-short-patch-repair endonuclease